MRMAGVNVKIRVKYLKCGGCRGLKISRPLQRAEVKTRREKSELFKND